MEFNEELAKQVIEKFSLSAKTLQVWRFRGKIPDKYISAEGGIEKPLSKIEKVQTEWLREILQTNKLHGPNFCEFARLDYHQIRTFGIGETRELPYSVFLKLKSTIAGLKLKVAQLVEEAGKHPHESDRHNRALKELIKLPYFKPTVVLRESGLKYNHAYAFAYRGNTQLDRERKQKILDSYALLAFQLSISNSL